MPIFNLTSCLILFAALFVVLGDTLSSLFGRWLRMDEAYSHGFLVVCIVLYLVYLEKEKIKNIKATPSVFAGITLFFTVLLFAVCQKLGIDVLQEMLLPIIIWLAFTTLFGWLLGRLLLVPILFLYFAIPFWDYLAYPLQLLTVFINEYLLIVFSIDAVIDGVFVTLPNTGVFEVAHGCSGLRYLIVGLTITCLFSILNLRQWKYRVLLVGIALLFSLVANWIRVFLLIFIGYKTNMTSSLIADHEFFGWVVFALSLVPVFVIANRLQGVDNLVEESLAITSSSDHTQGNKATRSSFVALGFILLSLMLPYGLFKADPATESFQASNISFENLAGSWKKLAVNVGENSFSSMKGFTHKNINNFYDSNNNIISLNLFVYPAQSPGKELIQYSNKVIDSRRWMISRKMNIDVGGAPFVLTELINRDTNRSYIILYSYYVSGSLFNDRVLAKLGGLKGVINGRYDGSLILLSRACDLSCESAEISLINFLKINISSFTSSIDTSLNL